MCKAFCFTVYFHAKIREDRALFEKNLEINYLLDFYGDVLSERKRTVLEMYYNDDLSLAEIAPGRAGYDQKIRGGAHLPRGKAGTFGKVPHYPKESRRTDRRTGGLTRILRCAR